MRVAFLGSGQFAVPILEGVSKSRHEVVLVVCPLDRPAGRGLKLKPCPVAEFAQGAGLKLHKTGDVNSPASIEAICEAKPEVILVADFGQILGPEALSIPPRGALNVHPSLLPKFRGPAPIPRAILAGERETGVTVILMSEEVDAGEIILQERVAIEDEDDNITLREKLSVLGAKLAVEALDLIEEGRAQRTPQDPSKASHAPWVRKEEAWLNWSEPATSIWRKVRAFAGWPVA
ncbi:MAG TPA: methionyl-tRNA formyltransferase, partial [Armatimonadetes bacterium]|nr:methionyl-tRNA formyltransferase [Armatimonadota bacterium]